MLISQETQAVCAETPEFNVLRKEEIEKRTEMDSQNKFFSNMGCCRILPDPAIFDGFHVRSQGAVIKSRVQGIGDLSKTTQAQLSDT